MPLPGTRVIRAPTGANTVKKTVLLSCLSCLLASVACSDENSPSDEALPGAGASGVGTPMPSPDGPPAGDDSPSEPNPTGGDTSEGVGDVPLDPNPGGDDGTPPDAPTGEQHWVGAWATGPQLTEPANLPPAPGLTGNSLRQNVF